MRDGIQPFALFSGTTCRNMPIPRYRIFSTSDASSMSRLQLTTRRVVEGIITGLHKSPHQGFSVEFSEHREYVPGDELRHLDWQAYARSDRYYIKLYEQETNLRATLVLDTSASMQFANKLDYARHLAACMAYLLTMQQDMVGLTAVDATLQADLPPASSPAHLDRLFHQLEQLAPGKSTHLSDQIHTLAERLPRRSLAILISDLWIEPAGFVRALQHLRQRKHQAIVLHLLDRFELDLPYDRQITLQDLETNEKLECDPRDLRESYKEQVQQYLTDLRRGCAGCDVEYHAMMVDEPYDKALVRLLARRK
jgi:uncharacterized protein (DUF58 family)